MHAPLTATLPFAVPPLYATLSIAALFIISAATFSAATPSAVAPPPLPLFTAVAAFSTHQRMPPVHKCAQFADFVAEGKTKGSKSNGKAKAPGSNFQYKDLESEDSDEVRALVSALRPARARFPLPFRCPASFRPCCCRPRRHLSHAWPHTVRRKKLRWT